MPRPIRAPRQSRMRSRMTHAYAQRTEAVPTPYNLLKSRRSFVLPRFPRIPRKSAFSSRNSARFSSRLFRSFKWVHTLIIHTFKCFINTFICFLRGGNTSKPHDYYRVLYKVSLYTFYQRNHMWFITIIGKLSYAKYITITSYLLKWKMLLYMYKSNTLLRLYVYVSILDTIKMRHIFRKL